MPVNVGEKSRALRARALAQVPGGVNSNVRLSAAEYFFTRGAGARMWDADGREYVDYALGQGPMLLGHSHAAIDGAVAMACTQGMVYAGQHPLEVVAAERFCSAVTWAEQLRFGMTGTEVVQGALRVARAATGRRNVIRAIGNYHGWSDSILLDMSSPTPVPGSEGQLPEALDGTVLVPWDDVRAVEAAVVQHPDDSCGDHPRARDAEYRRARAVARLSRGASRHLHPARNRPHLRRGDHRLPAGPRWGR